MLYQIDIKLVNIDSLSIDTILINIISGSTTLFNEELYIQNDVDELTLENNYFILTSYEYISTLTTSNFVLVNNDQKYLFTYIPTIIYIYPKYVKIPIQFLGLVNYYGNTISINVKYKYIDIYGVESDYIVQTLDLYNNNYIDYSYLYISGNATTISVLEITSSDSLITYEIYNTPVLIAINNKLKIYFYDNTVANNFFRIEYFTQNLLQCRHAIPVLIQNIDDDGNITNEYVVSLNLDLLDNYTNFYKVMYFQYLQYLTGSTINLIVFINDFNDYFTTTTSIPPVDPISNTNLYTILLSSDGNLIQPTIPTFLTTSNTIYLFMNLDYLVVKRILDITSFDSDPMASLLHCRKLNLKMVAEYITNYNLKLYNMFKLNNTYQYLKKQNININNNIVNCILVKIIFLYPPFFYYTIHGKLILDNYNLQVNHIEYDFVNLPDDRINLILMLLFLCIQTYQVNIIFYNDINDPILTLPFQFSTMKSPIWLFNEKRLPFYNKHIQNNNVNTNVNKYTTKQVLRTYQNKIYIKRDCDNYIKLMIDIMSRWYILFFYSDLTVNELVFNVGSQYFKILRLNTLNGNTTHQSIYYVVFNDIEELNQFMNLIVIGKLYISKPISTYYNISQSKQFILTDYYRITDTTSSGNIYFEIDKLYINSTYLYGNNYIHVIP